MANAPEKKPAAEATPPENQKPQSEQLSEEEMRKRYLEPQARRVCPGCGESPFLG